jgi:hypothetical protein
METDFSGNVQYAYIFFGGKRIVRQDGLGIRNYYFPDHLGTARVVNNASGSVLDDSDFCPNGKECYIAVSSSGNKYKFTGKERDTESGLDYFGGRVAGPLILNLRVPRPSVWEGRGCCNCLGCSLSAKDRCGPCSCLSRHRRKNCSRANLLDGRPVSFSPDSGACTGASPQLSSDSKR